jgi:predicted dehydrogenase
MASESPDSAGSRAGEVFRIGAIGVDSSHLAEFTRRINQRNDAGLTRCRVTAFWDAGNHRMPAEQVAGWCKAAEDLGAARAASEEALLSRVDGVMVLAVDGASHARLAGAALARGLPSYIDKPLTCSLSEARWILEAARSGGARCYSASSLRFAAELAMCRGQELGELVAIDAYGPGELNDAMPGVFFYGVHTIEMVDAIWGPGVERVRAFRGEHRDLVDLWYRDGRHAHLRLERRGCYDFGGTVHGSKGLRSFRVDFSEVYNRLIEGMTGFFEGGPAPAALRDIVENVAVMEAANLSLGAGGGGVKVGDWVAVERVE